MGVSISPALVNQLSTASTPGGSPVPANGKTITLAQLTPSGSNSDPTSIIEAALNAPAMTDLKYPLDLGPYTMLLSIADYQKAGFNDTGRLNNRFFISLPFPQQMFDTQSIRYETVPLGTIMGMGSSAVLGAGGFDVTGFLKGLGTAAAAEGVKALGKTQNAIASAGLVVNDFMTVMLQGPNYKTRSFSWKFAPKSAKEQEALRRIIQLINDSAAPSISGAGTPGSAFFNWPRIFTCAFIYDNDKANQATQRPVGDWTFYMKPAVIVDMSVNYTPSNVYTPVAPTRAPSSIELNLHFMELEYWLGSGNGGTPATGDYRDGGPPLPPGVSITPPDVPSPTNGLSPGQPGNIGNPAGDSF